MNFWKKWKTWIITIVSFVIIFVLSLDFFVWEFLHYTYRFTWIFEYDDGRIIKGKDDSRERSIKPFLRTNPSGKMMYIGNKGLKCGEYHLINGKKHGCERVWGLDGSLAVVRNFNHGVRDGEQKSWWDTGHLMSYEFFCNGKEHGVFTNWYQTGALQYITPFSNGAENGECFVYTPSGRLIGHSFVSNWNTVSGTVIMERSENKEALIGRYSNSVLVEKWYDLEKWK